MKKLSKIVFIILLVLLIFLVVSSTLNFILTNIEKNKYNIYGQYVNVKDKKMYLSILGEGSNTIVILPGSGCIGSTILYRPLAKKLAENNKVVIVEYFGYGFSDDINEKRNIDNIVEELRIALKSVCDNEQYILMPHSMSGIYSLYYAKQYPNEVKAIIGLDMTIAQFDNEENTDWDLFYLKTGLTKEDYYNEGAYPLILNPLISDTGIMRWINRFYNKEQYELLKSYNLYTEDELKVLQMEFNNYPSKALLMEYHNNTYYENINKLKNERFPENLPVLDFRASEPIKMWSEYMGRDTLGIIKGIISNDEIQKISIVNGSHQTVFLDAINTITEQTNEFINKIGEINENKYK